MPGVHQAGVSPQAARDAAGKWNDVQLAVGPHELAVLALDKDDPAAVGRDLGKVVAQAIVRGACDTLWDAAPALVERDAIEVVFDLRFAGIVGAQRRSLPWSARRAGFSAGKDDVFAIRAPYSIGLHVVWIVGSRKWRSQAGGATIPLKNATRGKEDLEKVVIEEVGDI